MAIFDQIHNDNISSSKCQISGTSGIGRVKLGHRRSADVQEHHVTRLNTCTSAVSILRILCQMQSVSISSTADAPKGCLEIKKNYVK